MCALVVLSFAGCSKKQEQDGMAAMMMQPVPVRAVSATQTDVPLEVTAVGNVESVSSVDVKSLVAGQVLRVDFREGQNVTKGQLLFEIDPEPLKRQIAELQANLVKDAALEQQARALVTKDDAQLKQAHAAADRGLELSKAGIFSKEQTEQVVATGDSAQASLDADKAAVESAVASIKADRAKLAETELQLTYTRILAPITGRAGAISIKAGNLVKENDIAMVTLLEMSPIYVTFGVPEQLLPEVQKHNAQQPLLVEAAPQGEKAETGALRFVDQFGRFHYRNNQAQSGICRFRPSLWPGEFVNVKTRLNVEHDRIVIPSRAVQTGPQGKYVWIMNSGDGSVAMRNIDVLRNYKAENAPEEAVIGSGLKAGELVISEGQMKLMPGAKVHLLKSEGQVGESGSSSGLGPS